MTSNVRMPAESDGEDNWEHRKMIAVAAVRASDPNLIGTQELFDHQGRYLDEHLGDYDSFGVSRRGNSEDEHMGVFYKRSNGLRFRFFNTHFAHRRGDAEARVNSARVILDRIPDDLPFLMTGDFNASAGGEVHELFKTRLRDAWETAAETTGPEGTFHGFSGEPGDRRIDWILFEAPWKARSAETITYDEQGRYPSDHFPVFAIFELR
ncbi:MAG: endonuclease/exonuclease/phosphatase family protein [bacterium]|nr:endonuclease/exonuclease/phosphatase family protein [bacterium]